MVSKKKKIVRVAPPIFTDLTDICNKFSLTEKILITPDYRLGREVLKALSRTGTPWVNFRMATASSLAGEAAENIIKEKKLKRVSGAGIMAIVEDIFYSLSDSNKLKYFKKHETNSGIINALTGVIMELRTKGIHPSGIKGEYLTKADKALDIEMIFSEYEKKLKEKGLIDKAGLTRLAIDELKNVPRRADRKYIIFSRYYMSGLEREFIETLAGGDVTAISDGEVFGVKPPKGLWKTSLPGKKEKKVQARGQLAWVYEPEKAKGEISGDILEIFASRGYREEIKEIFRRIELKGEPFDEAEIIYTDAADYVREIKLFAEKLGVPVTFSEGMPASGTRPFRAVTGFLEWVKQDFLELYLRRVLVSGDIRSGEKAGVSNEDMSGLGHLLKISGVGWSRHRYDKVLAKKEKEFFKKADKPSGDEEADNVSRYRKMAQDAGLLRKICLGLLALIPGPGSDGQIVLADMCRGVSIFLEKYAVSSSSEDEAFIEEALKRCAVIGELGRKRILPQEAADKLLGTFATIKVGSSDPKPGHIHVSHYKHGARSARTNTFLVGLDEIRFPGRRSEDPVLLDSERRKISSDLEVSSDNIGKNIYDMASLLSGIRGSFTASFSMYSVKEERNVFPSSLLLQLFRLKTAKADADYEEMMSVLSKEGSFREEYKDLPALDVTERWTRILSDKGVMKDGLEAVNDIYPWIEKGLKADEARESAEFTEYDGNIGEYGKELDPRGREDAVLSCSKLEKAAGCPFKYFLSNVLGIEKPEETEKDITSWLNPMQKGSLLHEVFENFTIEMRKIGGRIDEERGKAIAENILTEITEKYKEDVPPPNEMVYLFELEKMRKDIEIFLKTNRKLGTLPVHEELEFGTKDNAPVKIYLSGGEYFLLRGIIDRLDKVSAHEYHVWDYKTGSAYKYKRRQYLDGGEQLQHALYASAAETILKESKEDTQAVVTRSGYLLTSEKASEEGKGVIFWRDPSKKHIWQEALKLLFDIIAMGGFLATPKDKCSFCDYSVMCVNKKNKERFKNKKSSAHPAIELWEKLKEYE